MSATSSSRSSGEGRGRSNASMLQKRLDDQYVTVGQERFEVQMHRDDLDVLRTTLPGKIVASDQTRKRWKDIWTAGHGVGNIDDLPSTQALCQRLKQEYAQARLALGQRLAGTGALG